MDLLYANVKYNYSSTALASLGRSDHNLVSLTSSYKLVVQEQPVTEMTVRKWSHKAMETPHGALKATDWNALHEPHSVRTLMA